MRPPALCVQDEVARDSASSYRDGTASTTSSRRSTAIRAVEEAAAARTAMLQAETEAQRALACLADTRAECNEQHKAITAELEAMQDSVKCSLRAATQQTTVQAAKVDAIGYRQEEMEDLFLQRELRMEVQMAALNNKMHTLGAASRAAAPEGEQAKTTEMVASTSKVVPMRTPSLPITLKMIPKTEPRVLKPSPTSEKTNKVHVCAPNSLSSVPLPPILSFTRTQDQGVDPITTTSSTIDLTDTKATAGSHASSVEDEAYTTARGRTAGTSTMFLTTSEGIPRGNLCASSTRKKDNVNGELSMQVTRGSRDNSPAPSEEGDVISPEQLRFPKPCPKSWPHHCPVVTPPKLGLVSTEAPKRVPLTVGSSSCVVTYSAHRLRRPPTTAPGASLGTWKARLAIKLSTKPSPKGPPRKKCLNYWSVGLDQGAAVCKYVKPLPLDSNSTKTTGCST